MPEVCWSALDLARSIFHHTRCRFAFTSDRQATSLLTLGTHVLVFIARAEILGNMGAVKHVSIEMSLRTE